MSTGTRKSRVVVIGGGTVGSEVVRLLGSRGEVDVRAVLVRDAARPRAFDGWRELVTDDPAVVADADLVVEVAGGTGQPADLALSALSRGAAVVTANKAALAERWEEFAPHLRAGRVWAEAAVMGGAPVVGALSGALRGCAPVSLHAVLNGTCNVVLSAMESGATYESALRSAQEAGFAEADPTLDVEGVDAAHKVALLARLAFDPGLAFDAVRGATSGIAGLERDVVAAHAARGRAVRLVASVYATAAGWRAAVRPVSLPGDHPLVVSGPSNALVFRGDPLGTVVVRGPGAGGGATATAVVSDVIAAAAGGRGHAPVAAPRDHVAALAAGGGAELPEGGEALAA